MLKRFKARRKLNQLLDVRMRGGHDDDFLRFLDKKIYETSKIAYPNLVK